MRDRAGYLLAGLCLAALWAGYADGQSDQFTRHVYPGVMAPADRWEEITPSDTTNLTYLPRAVYANTAGTIAAVDGSGNVETFDVAANQMLPIRPVRINDTDTTDGISLRAMR